VRFSKAVPSTSQPFQNQKLKCFLLVHFFYSVQNILRAKTDQYLTL
jgi:hypothetical protein